jgi:hypothetical protein
MSKKLQYTIGDLKGSFLKFQLPVYISIELLQSLQLQGISQKKVVEVLLNKLGQGAENMVTGIGTDNHQHIGIKDGEIEIVSQFDLDDYPFDGEYFNLAETVIL